MEAKDKFKWGQFWGSGGAADESFGELIKASVMVPLFGKSHVLAFL